MTRNRGLNELIVGLRSLLDSCSVLITKASIRAPSRASALPSGPPTATTARSRHDKLARIAASASCRSTSCCLDHAARARGASNAAERRAHVRAAECERRSTFGDNAAPPLDPLEATWRTRKQTRSSACSTRAMVARPSRGGEARDRAFGLGQRAHADTCLAAQSTAGIEDTATGPQQTVRLGRRRER